MSKTLKEMIAVMQAAEEGKEIESARLPNCDEGSTMCWDLDRRPFWNWLHEDYRVKPAEPKKIFVNWYPDGSGCFHQSLEVAKRSLCPANGTTMEFIQLTPEVKAKLGL